MSNRTFGLLALSLFVALFLITSCGGRPKVAEKNISGKDTLKIILNDLSKKISDHPSDPDLLQQRSKYYLLDHRENMAFADISKAISLSPGKAPLYITLSDVYLGMGKPDNCNEALQKAISIEPRNNSALVRLTKLSLIIKDYKATFQYARRALEAEPQNPQVYFTMALALLEKGDTVTAVENFKKTIDEDQGFYEAYIELGELYSMRKDPIAVDYLKNAIRIRPDSKEALYMLGMFYQDNGRYAEALETYDKLAKADSTFKDAPYNTGYIYLVYLHDFRKATSYFSLALQRDPGYVEAMFNRGYSYELAGDYSKAYQDYKHVLQLRTNYQKAIDGLNRLDQAKAK
jgi:tetratricopeptide (TPR) repeat protein